MVWLQLSGPLLQYLQGAERDPRYNNGSFSLPPCPWASEFPASHSKQRSRRPPAIPHQSGSRWGEGEPAGKGVVAGSSSTLLCIWACAVVRTRWKNDCFKLSEGNNVTLINSIINYDTTHQGQFMDWLWIIICIISEHKQTTNNNKHFLRQFLKGAPKVLVLNVYRENAEDVFEPLLNNLWLVPQLTSRRRCDDSLTNVITPTWILLSGFCTNCNYLKFLQHLF